MRPRCFLLHADNNTKFVQYENSTIRPEHRVLRRYSLPSDCPHAIPSGDCSANLLPSSSSLSGLSLLYDNGNLPNRVYAWHASSLLPDSSISSLFGVK